MGIETDIGRIATAVEGLLALASKTTGAKEASAAAIAAAPVAAKPAAAKPAKAAAKPVAPPAPPAEEPGESAEASDSFLDEEDDTAAAAPTMTEDEYRALVRATLITLQKSSVNPEDAKEVLKKVGGADTLKGLAPAKFAAVIAAAEKLIAASKK
jgi:hypothetical protein